jgi:hypothetical protein
LVFPTGKNFARNALEHLSRVLMASRSAENRNKRRWIASSITPRIVKVLHTSWKCCRCALTSSLGLLENGLACTVLISAGLSSKFPSPTVTFGPVGTLVWEEAENSQIVLSTFSADKVLSSGSTVFSLDSRETSEEWGHSWHFLTQLPKKGSRNHSKQCHKKC